MINKPGMKTIKRKTSPIRGITQQTSMTLEPGQSTSLKDTEKGHEKILRIDDDELD